MNIERKSTDRFHELPHYRAELEKIGVTAVITVTGGKDGSYFSAYEYGYFNHRFVTGSRALYNRWHKMDDPINYHGTLTIT